MVHLFITTFINTYRLLPIQTIISIGCFRYCHVVSKFVTTPHLSSTPKLKNMPSTRNGHHSAGQETPLKEAKGDGEDESSGSEDDSTSCMYNECSWMGLGCSRGGATGAKFVCWNCFAILLLSKTSCVALFQNDIKDVA